MSSESGSESERYKNKLRRSINKNNGLNNKIIKFRIIDKDDLYSNIKIQSLTGKKKQRKKNIFKK